MNIGNQKFTCTKHYLPCDLSLKPKIICFIDKQIDGQVD